MCLTTFRVCHADSVQQPKAVFRPVFGRILTVVVVALMLTAVGGLIVSADLTSPLHFGPLLAFVAYGTWLLYGHPGVIVDAHHIVVINVGRTWVIPFGRLTAVETRYALKLSTGTKSVTAWAAPSPGRHQTLSLSLADFRTLRRGNTVENVRPGDAPNTESGSVAFVVRRRWEDALIDVSGEPIPEVSTTWHVTLLSIAGVLLVASLLGIFTA
jgi:hypothetical protein